MEAQTTVNSLSPEKTICEVGPSQLANLKSFILAVVGIIAIFVAWYFIKWSPILFLLVVPVFYAFWKWLETGAVKLKVTDQRLIVSEGILDKKTNETELYRVRDSSIEEPLLMRMFGLGNVIIYTTDDADSVLHFKAYKKPHWLKDQIRNNAEVCRQNRKGNENVLIHDQLAP